MDSSSMATISIFLIGIPIAMAFFAFWIWMLVSAIQNKGLTSSERIVWVLAIIFLHLLGGLIYLIIAWPKRNQPLTQNASV